MFKFIVTIVSYLMLIKVITQKKLIVLLSKVLMHQISILFHISPMVKFVQVQNTMAQMTQEDVTLEIVFQIIVIEQQDSLMMLFHIHLYFIQICILQLSQKLVNFHNQLILFIPISFLNQMISFRLISFLNQLILLTLISFLNQMILHIPKNFLNQLISLIRTFFLKRWFSISHLCKWIHMKHLI